MASKCVPNISNVATQRHQPPNDPTNEAKELPRPVHNFG